MTSKAALCYVLLTGKVVNISNIHKLTGYTNAAREIGRSIERVNGDGVDCSGFGVLVKRTKREGKNRYGVYSTWVDYKLEYASNKLSALQKMARYVLEQIGSPKTKDEQNMANQMKSILR